MSKLRSLKRSLSASQQVVARSSARHVNTRREGFKLEWYDERDTSHVRYFSGGESHRAWGWYHAKVRAGSSWVAIYEREGDDYRLIEAMGSMGLGGMLGADLIPESIDSDGSVTVSCKPDGKTSVSWRADE